MITRFLPSMRLSAWVTIFSSVVRGIQSRGNKPEKGAFIGGEPGPGMALDNPGDLLADAAISQKVSTLLRMHDGMGRPPADIVEHRAFPYQINPYKAIEHLRIRAQRPALPCSEQLPFRCILLHAADLHRTHPVWCGMTERLFDIANAMFE